MAGEKMNPPVTCSCGAEAEPYESRERWRGGPRREPLGGPAGGSERNRNDE